MLILGTVAVLLALCIGAAALLLFGYHRVTDTEYRLIAASEISHYVPAQYKKQNGESVTVATRGGAHGITVKPFAREWAYFYCGQTGRGGILNHFGRKRSPGGYMRVDIAGHDFLAAIPREGLRMRRWDSAIASSQSYAGPGKTTPIASPRLDRGRGSVDNHQR